MTTQNEQSYNQRSILKPTRLKNWLSYPSSSNKVTFQFELPKITGEEGLVVLPAGKTEYELTMAKGERNSLPGDKRSGMTPFLYTTEEFPDDAASQMIETTENGSKLKSKMHLLIVDEVPEQLRIWLKDLEDKILRNTTLSSPAKLAILRRLVNMEAQTIVSKTEEDFLRYAEPEDVEELKDYKIQENILATCTTDAQVRTYSAVTGNAAMRKLRIDHIMQEAIHRLKI